MSDQVRCNATEVLRNSADLGEMLQLSGSGCEESIRGLGRLALAVQRYVNLL